MSICKGLNHFCGNCGERVDKAQHSETCPYCRADLHCKNDAVPGYNFCNRHGGPSPSHGFYGLGRGMTSGKHSSFQLTRLAATYNEMQKDGRLLSTRHSIELVRNRIAQLAERIDLNQAPDRLKNLRDLWLAYKSLRSSKPIDAAQVSMQIDDEFEAAYHDYAAWKQMMEAIDLDRKLVESEVKIAKDLHSMLTAEEAYELVAKLMGAILRVVSDPTQLKAIQYEFTRIVGDQTINGFEPSGREVIDP